MLNLKEEALSAIIRFDYEKYSYYIDEYKYAPDIQDLKLVLKNIMNGQLSNIKTFYLIYTFVDFILEEHDILETNIYVDFYSCINKGKQETIIREIHDFICFLSKMISSTDDEIIFAFYKICRRCCHINKLHVNNSDNFIIYPIYLTNCMIFVDSNNGCSFIVEFDSRYSRTYNIVSSSNDFSFTSKFGNIVHLIGL